MSGEFTVEDRWAVLELLAWYDHVVDAGEWDLLGEVFLPDVRFRAGVVTGTGTGAVRAHEESLDPRPAHHVLGTVLRPDGPDRVRAWSRFLLSSRDATVATGDLVDDLVRTADGWRIAARRVTPRNRPGGTVPAEDHASALDGPV